MERNPSAILTPQIIFSYFIFYEKLFISILHNKYFFKIRVNYMQPVKIVFGLMVMQWGADVYYQQRAHFSIYLETENKRDRVKKAA